MCFDVIYSEESWRRGPISWEWGKAFQAGTQQVMVRVAGAKIKI